MNKSVTHNLRKSITDAATEIAYAAADALVKILNEEKSSDPELQRIEKMLLTLNDLTQQSSSGTPLTPSAIEEINEQLARYPRVQQLRPDPELDRFFVTNKIPVREVRQRLGLVPDEPLRFVSITKPTFIDETAGSKYIAAMTAVLFLLDAGLLDRVQRCMECQKWFFAKKRSSSQLGTFCGQPHYLAWWRRQPGVMEQRRNYQRKYYRDVLSPVTSRTVRKTHRRRK